MTPIILIAILSLTSIVASPISYANAVSLSTQAPSVVDSSPTSSSHKEEPQSSRRPQGNGLHSKPMSARDPYVIVSGDVLTMSGSPSDEEKALVLQDKIRGQYIWFRHDQQSYYITDPATIERAKSFFQPARTTQKSGERAATESDEAQIEKLQTQIKLLQRELAKDRANVSQSDADALEKKIGELQQRVSVLQAASETRQGRATEEASQKIRKLLENALQKGLAKSVPTQD